MLALLHTLVVQILVLTILLEILTAPFVVLWVALSIRRSLSRIADSIDPHNEVKDQMVRAALELGSEAFRDKSGRIANSQFGR
jgi:hypothetical protein